MNPTTFSVITHATAQCPWCRLDVDVYVNVGFTNHRAPGGKRATSATVRRTSAVDHDCTDPTHSVLQ